MIAHHFFGEFADFFRLCLLLTELGDFNVVAAFHMQARGDLLIGRRSLLSGKSRLQLTRLTYLASWQGWPRLSHGSWATWLRWLPRLNRRAWLYCSSRLRLGLSLLSQRHAKEQTHDHQSCNPFAHGNSPEGTSSGHPRLIGAWLGMAPTNVADSRVIAVHAQSAENASILYAAARKASAPSPYRGGMAALLVAATGRRHSDAAICHISDRVSRFLLIPRNGDRGKNANAGLEF
jgi:hypothetical protein